MALPARITVVKTFSYRGVPEEWSNTYGLTGGAWPTAADMGTAAYFLAGYEAACYLAPCKATRAIIYQPGAIISTRTINFLPELGAEPVGTLVVDAGTREWAGDQAGWIRGKIGVNSKGRPVYVRKYLHAGASENEGDAVDAAWKTAANLFVAQLTNGTMPEGRQWCGPDGEEVTLTATSDWVTTRTLKRRGKRPTP